MGRYDGVDIKSLTLDDALNDDAWGKHTYDLLRYFTIDLPVFQSLAEDFTADEMQRFFVVVALYFVNGIEPDYKSIHSSGVKQAVRMTIAAQKERLDNLFLTHYKQHIAAMQKREQRGSDSS